MLEIKKYTRNYWLVATAQTLLLPAFFAYEAHVYLTSAAYTFLWATSTVYHSHYNLKMAYILDQLAIGLAILCSFIDAYTTAPYGVFLITFGHSYNYYIFIHTKHSFSPKFWVSTASHGGIHVISSFVTCLLMMLSSQESLRIP